MRYFIFILILSLLIIIFSCSDYGTNETNPKNQDLNFAKVGENLTSNPNLPLMDHWDFNPGKDLDYFIRTGTPVRIEVYGIDKFDNSFKTFSATYDGSGSQPYSQVIVPISYPFNRTFDPTGYKIFDMQGGTLYTSNGTLYDPYLKDYFNAYPSKIYAKNNNTTYYLSSGELTKRIYIYCDILQPDLFNLKISLINLKNNTEVTLLEEEVHLNVFEANWSRIKRYDTYYNLTEGFYTIKYEITGSYNKVTSDPAVGIVNTTFSETKYTSISVKRSPIFE